MNATETQLADLESVIQELADRVQALTAAVDELSDEIQWRNNQTRDHAGAPAPFALTSLPVDPCTDDWAINRVGRDGQPAPPRATNPTRNKQTLFD